MEAMVRFFQELRDGTAACSGSDPNYWWPRVQPFEDMQRMCSLLPVLYSRWQQMRWLCGIGMQMISPVINHAELQAAPRRCGVGSAFTYLALRVLETLLRIYSRRHLALRPPTTWL